MMTCKQVSTLLAMDELSSVRWSQRLAVRLHLMMCDRCSTFRRWLDAIGDAGRALNLRAEREAPDDLEGRTLRRLQRQRP
jgi:predicted anti-sigma-YlaC factor YlaD